MKLFMSQRELERLDSIPRVRHHFILFCGVLGWGVPMFVLGTVKRWHSMYGWHFPPTPELYKAVLTYLPLCLVVGYLVGMQIWNLQRSNFDLEG